MRIGLIGFLGMCLLSLSTAMAAPLVELHDGNFVALRGPIDGKVAGQVVRDLYRVESDDIYLYISSPGGSVMDGYQIIDAIDTLQELGKNVHCVADVAISMAFAIFQSCPNRYVRGSTVLMQHQIAFGVNGPIEHVRSYTDFVETMYKDLTNKQAAHLNMTGEEFRQRTVHDWWLYGTDIWKANAADQLVTVKCSPELLEGTTTVQYETFFGPVNVVYSKCPLIRDPLEVSYEHQDEFHPDADIRIDELMQSSTWLNNYEAVKEKIM